MDRDGLRAEIYQARQWLDVSSPAWHLGGMTQLLDVPEVSQRLVRWSVEEYEILAEQGGIPRQAELLRGLVIEKMPKSPLHRALSKRLYDLIQKALPAGFIVFQEAPLRLSDSEPEPDISVVRGDEATFRERHPTTAALVIEVAVSSAALDRANASLYAEAGVEEYWIVLAREQQVEVYRTPLEGLYTERGLHSLDEVLEISAVTGVRVPVLAVFA